MTNSPRYLPALDGLRALAILIVVFSHFVTPIIPGGFGVTLFFFISGYIITTLLMAELKQKKTINIRAFYLRRLLRLTPALITFLMLAMLGILLTHHAIAIDDVFAALFYYANYWQIFHGFSMIGSYSPFSITWSLAIEEHFYLIYPILLIFLFKKNANIAVWFSIFVILILIWRIILVAFILTESYSPYRIYMGTDTRIDSIIYGALFAIIYQNQRIRSLLGSRYSFLIGMALLLFTLLYRDPFFRETFRYSVQGLAIALLFATIVLNNNRLSGIFSKPYLLYIGKISYSLYLMHWLVLAFLPFYLKDNSSFSYIFTALSSSFILAHLSYDYPEKIGRLLRLRWSKRYV